MPYLCYDCADAMMPNYDHIIVDTIIVAPDGTELPLFVMWPDLPFIRDTFRCKYQPHGHNTRLFVDPKRYKFYDSEHPKPEPKPRKKRTKKEPETTPEEPKKEPPAEEPEDEEESTQELV